MIRILNLHNIPVTLKKLTASNVRLVPSLEATCDLVILEILVEDIVEDLVIQEVNVGEEEVEVVASSSYEPLEYSIWQNGVVIHGWQAYNLFPLPDEGEYEVRVRDDVGFEVSEGFEVTEEIENVATNFGEYTDTVALNEEWTSRWVAKAYHLENVSGAEGGKCIRYNSDIGNGNSFISWDKIDPSTRDVEILGIASSGFNGAEQNRFYLRASGSAGSESGYFIERHNNEILLCKIVSGAKIILDQASRQFDGFSDRYYYFRFQAVGNLLKGKAWLHGFNEPGWMIEVIDNDFEFGRVGVGMFNGLGIKRVNMVSVAFNGDTALWPIS